MIQSLCHTLSDPYERQVPSRITRQGAQSRIEFIPMNVGAHWVYVSYAGQPVPGSPFVCLAYDSSKVRIIDVNHYGAVNQELGFTGRNHTSSAAFGN